MPNRILDLLVERFRAGLTAPTLISCDNLPNNGEFLQGVLRESARLRSVDGDFMAWLESIQIPNSMVDRIVPAITGEAIDRFESDFGYRDESLISTEPFRQWVVAPHAAPYDLAQIGIEVSAEVENYEQLKLRLFNGAHSTTAYFSQLAGYEYVYQAIAIPEWSAFIEKLQSELANSFTAPKSVDTAEYACTARARIGNSAVAHRSAQIAMDGSAKLPQRLFRALNILSETDAQREKVAYAIALWIRFLQSGLAVADPLLNALVTRAQSENAIDVVSAIMHCPGLRSPVIESEWGSIAHFVEELMRHSPLEVAKLL
jgi:fructuronate reductase